VNRFLVGFGFVAGQQLPTGGISSTKRSSMSKSRGSNSMTSIANSSNRGGSNSGNWSSMSNTNWDMRNSVDWGSMGSHNSLARVSLDCGVVDVRGLNDFLDGVDLVGSWARNKSRTGNPLDAISLAVSPLTISMAHTGLFLSQFPVMAL